MGDAEPDPPLGAPDATLHRTPLPSAVLDAPPGLAPRGFRAALVPAPAAAAAGGGGRRAPPRALGAAELHAPAATSMGLAVGRAALGALVAPGLLAPLPAAMGDAQPRRTSRALGAPFEPALLRMPPLRLRRRLHRIGCHRDHIGAHTKRALRHGRRRLRAELKATPRMVSATTDGVVRVIYQIMRLFRSRQAGPRREEQRRHVPTGAPPRRRRAFVDRGGGSSEGDDVASRRFQVLNRPTITSPMKPKAQHPWLGEGEALPEQRRRRRFRPARRRSVASVRRRTQSKNQPAAVIFRRHPMVRPPVTSPSMDTVLHR
uniref:Uncharacterized protein n=1 Tax=Oryza brachyantha TaxID=4533 RepID=J3LE40_ORYBR